MKCNNCGSNNPSDALKCQNCNAPLQGSMIQPSGIKKKKQIPAEGKACKNCGFENPEDALKCKQCNAPLQGSMILSGSNPEPLIAQPVESKQETKTCPSCGYPNIPDAISCVQCNYNFQQPNIAKTEPITQSSKPLSTETITPWEEDTQEPIHQFSLTPLDHETQQPLTPQTFEGDSVALNRKNTDPDNSTITSKKQATIVYRNGQWEISNNSTLKTTFIQVKNNESTPLKKGDIILLGNRLFVFNPED